MASDEPIPDVWTELDLPALRSIAVHYLDAAPDRSPYVRPEVLAERLGVAADDLTVRGAVERLTAAGYVTGASVEDTPYDYITVTGITQKGLRAAGAWPTEDRLLDVLAEALDGLVERASDRDPEHAGALRNAAAVVKSAAQTVGAPLLVTLISQAAGLRS